jgi:hypothetical protein
MGELGDRFDQVQERTEHEALARELTDVNGWLDGDAPAAPSPAPGTVG